MMACPNGLPPTKYVLRVNLQLVEAMEPESILDKPVFIWENSKFPLNYTQNPNY